MNDWTSFPHTKGACLSEDCPSHGVCHCGCGAVMLPADRKVTARERLRGVPALWKTGVHSGNLIVPPERRPRGTANRAHIHDVPIERVLPLAKWLHEQAGSLRAAAEMCGMSPNTFSHIRYRNKASRPETAQRILETVLAFRRSKDVFQSIVSDRRPPTLEERLASRREKDRLYQRRYRAIQKEPA